MDIGRKSHSKPYPNEVDGHIKIYGPRLNNTNFFRKAHNKHFHSYDSISLIFNRPRLTNLILIIILHILDLSNLIYFSQYSIEVHTLNTNKPHNRTIYVPYSQIVTSIKVLLANTLYPLFFKKINMTPSIFHLSITW